MPETSTSTINDRTDDNKQNDVLVRVKNLVKEFPVKAGAFSFSKLYVHAVNNITFDIKRGEIFGMVGESGCGKTTTGRLLLRIHEPTSGDFYYTKQKKKLKSRKNV
jgi:ABC-type oligopeptide transport system ATPase subunit